MTNSLKTKIIEMNPNYQDVWDSHKKIRIVRSITRASGKSYAVSTMAIYEALSGRNVLCLMRNRELLRYGVMTNCLNMIKYMNIPGTRTMTANPKYLAITFKNGSEIRFASWDDDMLPFMKVGNGNPYDFVWWEDCEKIDYQEMMYMIENYYSMRGAIHVCTGMMYQNHPGWLIEMKSDTYQDVFDKSYKDNPYLDVESVKRIRKEVKI